LEKARPRCESSLRVAKNNTGMCVDLGLGASARARRLDVHTTREGTEANRPSREIGADSDISLNAEHRLRQRISVLSGGVVDERINGEWIRIPNLVHAALELWSRLSESDRVAVIVFFPLPI
jgi:hypothetical protein